MNKSDFNSLSPETKLNYFKRELIKRLAAQEKKDKQTVKKALSFLDIISIQKSAGGTTRKRHGVGEHVIWHGQEYVKVSEHPARYKPYYRENSRGAQLAAAAIAKKIRAAKDIDELMQIVQDNMQRFGFPADGNDPLFKLMKEARKEWAENKKSGKSPLSVMSTKEMRKKYGISEKKKDANNKPAGGNIEDKKKALKEVEDAIDNAGDYDDIEELENERQKLLKEIKAAEKKSSSPEKKESAAEKTKNQNAYKGGLARDTIKFVKEVKGEPYHAFETDTNKFVIHSNGSGKCTGVVMSQDIADIIDSHNEPSILDWRDNIADEIHEKYPNIDKDYVKLALGGIRPGYRSGKKENIKIVENEESEAEKHQNRSDAMKGNQNAYKGGPKDEEKTQRFATQDEVDEATAACDKKTIERKDMLKKPATQIQQYANSNVEDFEGGIDKFIEHMREGNSDISMQKIGNEFAKLINHNIARDIWNEYESGHLKIDENGLFKAADEDKPESEKNDTEKAIETAKEQIKENVEHYKKSEYNRWSAESIIRKLGKKKLEVYANAKIELDAENYEKDLIAKVESMIKDGKTVSETSIGFAVNNHFINIECQKLARAKLESMEKVATEIDLPVDPADMTEARSIIGADVTQILNGRDTYGNVKQTLTDKIRRRVRNNPGVARAMLVFIKQEQERTGKTVYTPKHSIWEVLPKLNENAKQAAEKGEGEKKTGTSGVLYHSDDGVTVVEDKDWGRYKVEFPGKPDSDTISTLKHNGFRWSPKNKVWVCYNTANGEYSLKRVAEKLGWKKGDSKESADDTEGV